MKGLLAINKRNIKELSHMEKEAVHVVKEMGMRMREKKYSLGWFFYGYSKMAYYKGKG